MKHIEWFGFFIIALYVWVLGVCIETRLIPLFAPFITLLFMGQVIRSFGNRINYGIHLIVTIYAIQKINSVASWFAGGIAVILLGANIGSISMIVAGIGIGMIACLYIPGTGYTMRLVIENNDLEYQDQLIINKRIAKEVKKELVERKSHANKRSNPGTNAQ